MLTSHHMLKQIPEVVKSLIFFKIKSKKVKIILNAYQTSDKKNDLLCFEFIKNTQSKISTSVTVTFKMLV